HRRRCRTLSQRQRHSETNADHEHAAMHHATIIGLSPLYPLCPWVLVLFVLHLRKMANPTALEQLTGFASRFGAFVAERHPFALAEALETFEAVAGHREPGDEA